MRVELLYETAASSRTRGAAKFLEGARWVNS